MRFLAAGVVALGIVVGVACRPADAPATGKTSPSASVVAADGAAPAPFSFTDVQVTGDRTCATGSDHLAYRWGEDISPRPVPVPGLRAVVATRCSGTEVCALDRYGAITCVGGSRRRASPDEPETPDKITGLPPASSFALNGEGGCAIASGDLWCWRHARFTADDFPVVEPVEGIHDVVTMHTNFAGNTCVTRRTGVPLCVSPFPQPRAAPFKKGAAGADLDAGLPPLKRTIVELTKWPDARDVLPLNDYTLHVCAILPNGSSTCDPAGTVFGIALARAVGDGHAASFFDATDAFACVRLDSGAARCAEDYFAESHLGRVAKTLGHPSAISVGDGHACAIAADGLVCWGSASRGQLGDGTPYDHARPAKVPNISDAVRLSVGPELTCVIHKDGALSCWGAWRDDSSVRSRASEQFTPVRITPPFAASSVFVGSRLSNVLCAMGPAGPSCLMGTEWMPVTVPHRKIKGLVNSAVVTDDNRAFGFGWEGGRIVTEPEDFEKAGIRIASVAPDDYCGVTPDGDVVCGHCGACNGAEAKKVMTRIHGAQPFVEATSLLSPASAMNQVVCARTVAGTVECHTGDHLPWGRSTDLKRIWEQELSALHDIVQISAHHGSGNDNLLCTLDKQGAVRCLGDDAHGQRGARQKGSTEPMPAVTELPPVVEIGTAADHACARTAAGDVYCWGSNERGGAPDGAPALREVPVKVAPPAR